MTWVKIDDSFADHPKVVAAGPIAALVHVRALCYAARHLTDGVIPFGAVSSLCSGLRGLAAASGGTDLCQAFTDASEMDWASVLVEHGLWNYHERGYEIHDYLEYNPSRASVLAERATKKANGAKGGAAKAAKAASKAASEPASKTLAPATTQLGRAVPVSVEKFSAPVPVPVPVLSESLNKHVEVGADAPTAVLPSVGDQLRELEKRYPRGLAAEVRDAIALGTRRGKISDPRWLKALQRFATIDERFMREAMTVFVEQHADGEKAEGYLMAIAKRMASRPAQKPLSLGRRAEAERPEAFDGDDLESIVFGSNREVVNG